MIKHKFLLVLSVFALSLFSCKSGFQKTQQVEHQTAAVIIKDNYILATTGQAARKWELSPLGLITRSLKNNKDQEYLHALNTDCDWHFSWMNKEDQAELLAVNVRVDDDEGFMQSFIRTSIEFRYPKSKIDLKYDIWTMPNAPGFRTQISLRKNADTLNIVPFSDGIVAQFQLKPSFAKGQAIGYYNDTQHRNTAATPILKIEPFEQAPLNYDWASLFNISAADRGFILVKESHKCVNQQGVHTGNFQFSDNQLSVTGTGLDQKHINTAYQKCWATWSILYTGEEIDAQLALKDFDRKRYPIDPERDIYIMSNTWGSGSNGADSKYASRESNILKEIATSKELGLDLLQIDDGWQGTQYNKWETVPKALYKNKKPNALIPHNTAYEVYPEGWKNVRKYAKESGIKLGLWAAWGIPYKDLKKNYELGDFRSYKLDFAKLKNYEVLSEFENRVRRFIIDTDHKVRVNWDVTENPPRIGYFFGREYGNIYLENRKPQFPENVLYKPWLVLRDAWHVAQYTNLNKFQITYQNPDRTDKNKSDATLHSHEYCLGLTLMGSPIFFQEIHLLSERAKAAIKPIIQVYKQHRDKMYQGYVFAIGNEPTNQTFTGFQNYHPESQSGYLTLFKERACTTNDFAYELYKLKGKKVKFTNLLNKESWIIEDFNTLKISFGKGADFRFLRYELV